MTTAPESNPALLRVCDLIAEGDTVAQACKSAKVAPRVFFRALAKDADEGLRQSYARARKARADSRAWQIEEIIRRTMLPKTSREYVEPNAARVAIDALRWLMGKENVSRYGDRIQVEDTTPAKQLTREESRAILLQSGMKVEDIFNVLTKPAAPLELVASESATPPAP